MNKKISDEQWVLFLSMLKICRSIKLAAERCGIAPATAYHRGYKNVEYFQEMTKILQGDYEAQCLPSIIKAAEEIERVAMMRKVKEVVL